MSTIQGYIFVCVDCTMQNVNGESDSDTTWSLWSPDQNPDNLTVTANFDSNTEDGMIEFSGSPCDGCGTWLAGSRYRYAVWSS